ncbi:MAG TPA: aminoglycoside phosphotransferase [Nakamurella sp.]|nr:aminoglycoside phosphotransferase [Nakamurella sp.]
MSDEESVEASSAEAAAVESEGVGLADHVLIPILAEYLPHQRWFSAKGQELGTIEIIGRAVAARDLHGSDIEQVLFTVDTLFGLQRYQLWIGWSWQLPDRLAHATIGSGWGRVAYDALQDQNVAALLIRAIADNTDFGDVQARAEPDAVIDTSAPGLVIGAEQSNTSIVYGHSAILKVFRRLEPGPNPDAEILRALHAVGSTHIAQPLGVITGPVQGEETTLGLLTEFFANSADGWAMATSSVRDLMSEGDLRADEVGGDFAAESHRLGAAVAAVHADLAQAFGTTVAHQSELSKILDQMVTDAEVAISLVPDLAEHREEILATFARAGDHAAGITVQRIHGDLHLGQVLRTLNGWSIIDFEGEPSKPLAYRRSLHSPLKDIAGMLRSFDYAARGLVISQHTDAQHKYRAAEWAERNRRAFSDGYASVAGNDPRKAGSLLRAFELDKALYEVVYEHGHRPRWVAIPMQAVVALINAGGIS